MARKATSAPRIAEAEKERREEDEDDGFEDAEAAWNVGGHAGDLREQERCRESCRNVSGSESGRRMYRTPAAMIQSRHDVATCATKRPADGSSNSHCWMRIGSRRMPIQSM